MISNKQFQNPIHKETLDCVLRSLEDTKLWDKDVTKKFIRHSIDGIGPRKHSLKLSLFLNPLLTILAFFVIYIIAFYISNKLFSETLIFLLVKDIFLPRFAFFLLTLFPYVFYSVKLIKMVPKSPVGYDKRWSTILIRFLSNSKITETHSYNNNKQCQEAKRRLTTSIQYYQRESEVIKFFMTVIGSGILMETLADKEFQVALYDFSAAKLFDINPLGSICLIVSPFVFIYYIARYYLPIAWMQQIVDQIELLNE
jgi:hypothetical protein